METNRARQIASFVDPGLVRALNAAVERSPLLARKFLFVHCKLGDQPKSEDLFEMLLVALDLGQALPLESLRPWSGRPGVCAFLQPTPSQLLALSELPHMVATTWDGTQVDKVLERVHRLSRDLDETIRLRSSMETLQRWVAQDSTKPERLILLNPPANWKWPVELKLDSNKALYRMGAPADSVDFCLPIGSQARAELIYLKDQWVLQSGKNVIGKLETNSILSWESCEMMARSSADKEQLIKLGRRFGWVQGDSLKPGSQRFLSDVLQHLMLSAASGELKIRSGTKNATFVFFDGWILQASAGWVQGEKAVFRCLAWEEPQWRFLPQENPTPQSSDLWIGGSDFFNRVHAWRSAWTELQGRLPPPSLRIQVVPQTFRTRAFSNPEEFQVLCAVAEYGVVHDIVNQCLLHDHRIYGQLIQLRKQGVILPSGVT